MKQRFDVTGMTCSACSAHVEKAVRSCGVDTSGVSFDGNAPTTLAVVSLDGQGERSFQFYRDMGADTRLARQGVGNGEENPSPRTGLERRLSGP